MSKKLKYHMETGSEATQPISLRFNGQNISAVRGKGQPGLPGQSLPEHGVDVWHGISCL